MNIQSQELLLLNKNMKFKQNGLKSQPAPTTEPPINNPETKFSGLDAQANYNIAFQRKMVNPNVTNKFGQWAEKAGHNVKTGLLGLAATITTALPLAPVAVATTSCEPINPVVYDPGDVNVHNEITVNVDLSALTAFIEAMAKNNEVLQGLLEELKQSNLNDQQIIDLLMSNNEFLKLINEQLIKNGKTEEEAAATLEKIYALIEEGDYKAALALITQLLTGIDNKLGDILAEVRNLSEKITNYHEEYMQAQTKELMYLKGIYNNGILQNEKLDSLKANSLKEIELLQEIRNNTDSLYALATDEEKYNKFIEDIKNANTEAINESKLIPMLDMLGLKFEDLINMTSEKFMEVIKNFQNEYLKNEEEKSKKMDKMTDLLGFISKYLQVDLSEQIGQLIIAANNNTDMLDLMLDEVIGHMQKIIDQLKNFMDKFDQFAANFSNCQNNLLDIMAILKENGQKLDSIKNGQNITNETLASMKKDTESIDKKLTTANNYLYVLTVQNEDLKEAISKIPGSEAMTVDQFREAVKELIPEFVFEFEQMLMDLGFDKIPGDILTIKDFLSSVDGKLDNLKDYTNDLKDIKGQLAVLIDLFANYEGDKLDPELLAKLDEIFKAIQEAEDNCCCCNNNDEGTGDSSDLGDDFS